MARLIFKLIALLIVGAHCVLSADIRAVIFDFGGVMVDGDRKAMVGEISDSLGIPMEVLATTSKADRNGVYSGLLSDQALWERRAERAGVGLPHDWKERLEEIWTRHAQPVEGMFELVAQVQERGFLTPMLSDITALTASFNWELGFYEPFEPLFLSCEMGCRKPSPEIFWMALEGLGLEPEECVFIDDRKYNIETARKIGMHGICFQGVEILIDELRVLGILENH